MSSVFLSNVTKKFGEFHALKPLDLKIQEGEFLTLLGPSGCGKTTTLRLVAGFMRPTSGRIFLGEDDVTNRAPQAREMGMVFQDYALFPHMSIRSNLAFGLVERRYPKEKIRQRVDELLQLVELPDVGDRLPSELSGGQRQRIAVARAVAHPPRVLLMDEPLSALDLKLRESMQVELRRLQQELKITTLFVTHDQTEAMSMSDRIVVMNGGVVEQIGTPTDIYERPKTKFVAQFIGQSNLLDGEVVGTGGAEARVRIGPFTLDGVGNADGGQVKKGKVTVAIRPEALSIKHSKDGSAENNVLRGCVNSITFTGNLTQVRVSTEWGKELLVETRPADVCVAVGDTVDLVVQQNKALIIAA